MSGCWDGVLVELVLPASRRIKTLAASGALLASGLDSASLGITTS